MPAPLATRLAGVGAVLVLVLTGCAKSDPAPAESTTGPLEQFFGDIYSSYDEEKAAQEQREIEEAVAACMADQGFEYTPVDYSQMGGFGPVGEVDELDVQWGTLEFAKKYGYGITTDPYGTASEAPVDGPKDGEFVDPNQDYVNAMSAEEQQAYYEALYGTQSAYEGDATEGEATEVPAYDWTQAGCQGQAQHEVQGDQPWTDPKYTDLMDELNTLYTDVQNDPELADLTARWATCMADAGYEGLATVDDAQNGFYDKVNDLWSHAYDGLDMESATEEDFAAVDKQVQAEMSGLSDDEIATATADFTCRDDVDYTQTQLDVQFAHEQAFIDAHRDELEAMKAAVQDAQG